MVVGVTMMPCFVVSMICNEFYLGVMFGVIAGSVILAGFILWLICRAPGRRERFRIGDGLLAITLCWLLASLIGALPYYLSGSIEAGIDAFFESCSGFTTTGATTLTEINHLPRGILFWRSMTSWTGGIGILILGVALMPALGLNAQRLTADKIPGPTLDFVTAKMFSALRTILILYLSMTILETVLLSISGMTVFNALLHSMSTVSTGGFSRYDDNIAHFSSRFTDIVIMCFMLLSGMNYNLFVKARRNGARVFLHNTELSLYGLILAVAGAISAVVLYASGTCKSMSDAVFDGLFQTISAVTTTGFTTADYRLWPQVLQMILILLMFTGACSSSTGGGLKLARLAVILKLIRHGISMRLHPRFFETVKLNQQGLSSDTVSGAATVPFLFLTALFGGVFLLTFCEVSIPDGFSAGLACLCNTGIGVSGDGLQSACGSFSGTAKLILSVMMIGGRLELYALLVLLTPKYWTGNY